jgi:Rhodopirellula transposase DDE domain
VIVKLFAATTTRTGLRVRSELDTNAYPAGVTVSDADMQTLYLRPTPSTGSGTTRCCRASRSRRNESGYFVAVP